MDQRPGMRTGIPPRQRRGERLGEELIAERLVEELNHARLMIEADAGVISPTSTIGRALARLRAASAAISNQRAYQHAMGDYAVLLVLAGATRPTWPPALESILAKKAVADHINSISRHGTRPNVSIALEMRGLLADHMGLPASARGRSEWQQMLQSLTGLLDALDHVVAVPPTQNPAPATP